MLGRNKIKKKTKLTELPILPQWLRPRTLDPETRARALGGTNFLCFVLLINSALARDKTKNNLTELPILPQQLRPRALNPETRARALGGPNFFMFNFIN